MPAGVAFSDHHREAFLALVREGRPPRIAAEMISFHWRTVQRHLEEDHDFRAEFTDALEHPVAVIEDALFKEAKDGNLGAQKFWLANRAGHRWADDRTRAAGQIPGGAGGSSPEILVGAVREALTEVGERGVAMLLAVPLPEQNGGEPEAIEATATEKP